MTETAFRVAVKGLRFGPNAHEIQAAEIASPLRHYGFEGVTVTPMDDALIKAAEDVRNACLGKPVGGGDGGTYVMGHPTADQLNALTAAIANARGDTK